MSKLIALFALTSISTLALAAPEHSTVTIAVEGDVLKPGLYPVKSDADLMAVLQSSGGLSIRPERARVTIDRGPGKTLSFSAALLFDKKHPRAVTVKLEESDYVRVDSQPLNRPDPIMTFVASHPQRAGFGPPVWSSFVFNGIRVYLIPVPGLGAGK